MAYFRSHVLVSVDPVCVEKGAYDLMDALQDVAQVVHQPQFEGRTMSMLFMPLPKNKQ